MNYCYDKAAKKGSSVKWGEIGPRLLTSAIREFDMWSHVAEPHLFCPVNWRNWKWLIDGEHDKDMLDGSKAVHLCNEMWRLNKTDKSGEFEKNSIYEQLKRIYLRGV